MQLLRLRVVITWLQCRFDFGRYIWLNISPTQSVLRIFARNFVQACLGVPESDSFRKNGGREMFPSYGNAWLLLTFLKACDWSGHIFGASARSFTQKNRLCHPLSTVHDRRHDARYVTFELLLHAAFAVDETWGDMLEPARTIVQELHLISVQFFAEGVLHPTPKPRTWEAWKLSNSITTALVYVGIC